MKKIILLILLTSSFCTFAQDKKEVNLIQTDKTWGKEIIQVPFWFAPKIGYKGQEDIRFAKGWEDINSDGFWVLVFAWDINLTTKPTAQFFEDNLKLYFDGLMKVVNEDSTITIPKTKASFSEKEKLKEGVTTFSGTVETYDAFTTKKMLKLNVTIESYYCKESKQYIPLFKFAPRGFKHKAWEMLKQTKLHDSVCNKPKNKATKLEEPNL